MEPTRDPAPRARRRWTDRWAGVDLRPLWLEAVGLALIVMSALAYLIDAWTGPVPAGGWSWGKVGLLLIGLSSIFMLIMPGLLIALRRPEAEVFLRVMGKRFAHPRVAGLAIVWAGLLLTSIISAGIFLPSSIYSDTATLSRTLNILWVIGIVAIAPLLALSLFDRGREPPDG